eukprot:scaffold795_cov375-Prasinococcus_capsulatus_cf.AAC.7
MGAARTSPRSGAGPTIGGSLCRAPNDLGCGSGSTGAGTPRVPSGRMALARWARGLRWPFRHRAWCTPK